MWGRRGTHSVLDVVLAAEYIGEPPVKRMEIIPRIESDHLPVSFVINNGWE